MAEIHVYEMNDTDWYAAESVEDAKRCMAETLCYKTTPEGIAEMCEEFGVKDPVELDAEAMERHQIHVEGDPDDEKDSGETRTFARHLAALIDEGEKFPSLFASTEY